MFKRPFRRSFRRRRRPRVTWYVPPLFQANVGGGDDALTSCYADTATTLAPLPVGPTALASPIIRNFRQTVIGASDPVRDAAIAHPVEDSWRVRRIVGDIGISCNATQDAPTDVIAGVRIRLGIVYISTLGDAILDPSPTLNDDALQRWLWLHTVDMAFANLVTVGTATDASSAQLFQLPVSGIVPVDVRSQVRVRTEHQLALIVEAQFGAALDTAFSVDIVPKLRVLLSSVV